MASIFSLYGSIFIDNEKANSAIDETTNKGKASEKSFASSVGSMVKSAAKVGTAIVTGTSAAVGGLVALSNKTASTADEIDKGSIRMGIGTKYYQELKYAAGQCGVEMTSLEKAAKKLEGTDLNMEDAMQQIMSLSTAEERAAKAGELFGDNIAYTLSPLIEQNTEDYDGLIQRANELGIVMSEDAVSAGVVFGDTMSDISQSLGGVFNTVMSSLIPVIQEILNLIIDNMPIIHGIFSSLAPVLTQLLSSLLPPLMSLAASILPMIIQLINTLLPFITQVIEAILPVIIDLLTMLLPPLMQIIELILPLLLSLLEPLLPLLEPIFQLLQPFIDLLMVLLTPLLDLINIILPPIISLLTTIINAILPPLQAALNVTAGVLTNVFGAAFKSIQPIIDGLKTCLDGIITFIKGVFSGNWKQAWEGIKQIFSGIVSTFTNIFKAPINFIIDGINAFIGGLNKIKIPDWVPAVGGKGINIPLIKRLRVGMEYVPYDDMPAILHKGERVLDKEEAKEYDEVKNGTVINNETNNFNLTINSTEPLSPAETARQTRKALQDYNLRHRKAVA